MGTESIVDKSKSTKTVLMSLFAEYAAGPARPTGGCGAVAMLVGRDTPLQFDMKSRTTYAADVWDFFKPEMDSEYPEDTHALWCC